MDKPLRLFPADPEGPRPGALRSGTVREAAQRSLRRRLLALLASGGTAFVLTTWVLVRYENRWGFSGLSPDPARVVRAQLEALNRGELRAAYELFSQGFRQHVSFEAYHELVVTHREMFHTQALEVSQAEDSGDRAVLETRLLAGGKRYRARFTLIRTEGRWWIDDVRWGAEPDRQRRIAI